MGYKTVSDVVEWLKEGREDADNIIDLAWEVIEEHWDDDLDVNTVVLSHPRIPVRLLLLSFAGSKERRIPTTLRLVIETNIPTVDMDASEKLSLYRSLMSDNRMKMAKYYLYGEDHKIAVAADLYLRDLTREELEEALEDVLLGYFLLRKQPHLASKLEENEFLTFLQLIYTWLERNKPQREIINKLKAAGLDENSAREILEQVHRVISGSQEERGSNGSRRGSPYI